MPKVTQRVWRFFASVKLALISLFSLAAISIIGTLIKQKQGSAYYIQEYGANVARFFEMLDIPDMYSSWWFTTLLCLFAVNLIICTIERLPGVWRMVVLDNLTIDHRQLEKMGLTHRFETGLTASAAAERLQHCLSRAGWRNPRRHDSDEFSLIFTQKGAWTRLSVYVVHMSILVILAGAMIGMFFGYQAYVFLPEGRGTSTIYMQGTEEPVPLGFELQCDRLEMDYYPNGMVRQSRVDLTVNDPEHQTSFQKSTIVNDPLAYRGLTFYQADSYPIEEFLVLIHNRTTGAEQGFRVPPERDVVWPGTDTSFRIEDIRQDQEGTVQKARISFTTDGAAEPSEFWIENNGSVTIHQSGADFTISIRQFSTILLLVTRDPGILFVYSGCILMLVGLAISFFLAHRRIWILVAAKGPHETRILVSGVSNKHKPAFARRFQELVDGIGQDAQIISGGKDN